MFWSSFVARPLVLPEGVRVVRGCLPCPWSVAACADASSAFVSRLFLFVLWRASVVFVLFVFCLLRVALVVSVVCCGCAWGVLLFLWRSAQ